MTTLDKALEAAMQLSQEEREELITILRNRQVKARREEISQSAEEARRAFYEGELRPEAPDMLLERLHASLEDE